MKKFLLFFAFAMLTISITTAQANLYISEVADPKDDYSGRFVELFNSGLDAIDFSVTTVFLSRQSNGGTTWGDVQLTGTVAAGETYVLGGSSFSALFGFAPDLETGILSSNGDDAYYLFTGGDHTTGVLHDIYGELDTDGTGTDWEFLDARAERNVGVDLPNTTWTALEWTITAPANIADFNPGVHAPVSDIEAPVWGASYPMAANILETSFDIASKLDETSTVYYVVLASGETAPNVAEVMAGTGAAGAGVVTAGSYASGSSETLMNIMGLTADATYSVYLVAEDDESTPNVQADVVTFDVTPTAPPSVLLSETFDANTGSFTAVSVIGDTKTWWWEEYGGNGYMEMQAPTDEPSEDWLISGAFNLDAATGEMISFKSVNNFGDAATTLTVFLSNDFTGDYTTTGIAAATWDDVTSNFTLSSGGSYTMVESGEHDISDGTGTGYIAFVYTFAGTSGSGMWEIDDVMVTGYLIPGSDATLSDISVDATTLSDFDAAKTSYVVELAAGTTTVPTVAYVTTDANATVIHTDATDLAGDDAARTTTVEVTAQDGVTVVTYSIMFNPVLEVSTFADLRAADQSRTFLYTGNALLTYQNASRGQKYIQDATGGVMIDDPDAIITTTYAIGDILTGIKGELTTYGQLLELIPLEDPGAAVSSGNDVTAELVTIDQLNASLSTYESTFVKIDGISFSDAGADFASKKNYDFSDGTNSSVLRTNYSDLDYIGSKIPKIADISGLVIQYNGTIQILPRFGTDINAYSSDASLSSLMVNAVAVDGFVAGTMTYAVLLDVGTTTVPAVTYTTTDTEATAVVTDATDLYGDEPARTTSIEVTAVDGTVATYTIVFTVDNTSLENSMTNRLKLYPVPATDMLTIEGMNNMERIEIVNIVGNVVKSINVDSEKMSVNISNLSSGVYFIRANESTYRFIKK